MISVRQRCQTGLGKERACEEGGIIECCTASVERREVLIQETEGTVRCGMLDLCCTRDAHDTLRDCEGPRGKMRVSLTHTHTHLCI